MGMLAIAVHNNPEYLSPGTYVAYIYNGRLNVGVTETGLDPATSVKFTVKNCKTGKIEYPYTTEVLVPNAPVKEVESTLKFKDI